MEKKQYDDIFIVLTYRNTEDILDFLESIKKKITNYRIIIVNSFYDEESDKQFEKIAADNDCDFLSVENKGYGCGNNRGIEYAKEHYEFRRIVISNPDIEIKEYNPEYLDALDDGLIGGKITNLHGKKQNPLRVGNSWITTNAAYYYYCKNNIFLFFLGVLIAKIARTAVVLFKRKKASKVYAVHGSFLVIPKTVLEQIGTVFDENLFMFGEELDLAERLRKSNIPTYYVPQIEVLHKEDGSIKMSDLNLKEKMKISCEYVYNKHWKKHIMPKQNINVLHINCNYMSTALHQIMVEHLDLQGVNSVVFAPICNKKRNVIKPNKNVIVSKCFNKLDRYIFYYKQRKIRNSLEKKISVKEFDCIHAYTLFTDGNTAYELSKKYQIPYVVAVRDTDVNAFFKIRILLRKRGSEILKNASAVFFLSDAYRKTVLEKYVPREDKEFIREKSYVIPNGIDDFWIKNMYTGRNNSLRIQDMKARRLRAVYVGAISRRKNISTTIKALNVLKDEGWHIEFAVAGKKQSNQEFFAMRNFAGTNYLGKLKKEEIINCYRESDIFIMPSRTETFGLVYAEAMSQGLPIIYTKGQGFDGQFAEGMVGYSVEASCSLQIVEAVKKIINNYEEVSQNCITSVKKFRWDAICEQYVAIYKSIV